MAISSDVDAVDADLHDILTMSLRPLGVILPALLAEDANLVAAGLTENRGDDGGALHDRRTDLRLIAADHQHISERDFLIVGAAEHVALDGDDVSFADSVLLSTGTDDGVHNDLREFCSKPRTPEAGGLFRREWAPPREAAAPIKAVRSGV